MTAKEKRLAYEQIERHEADIVIGTHALIQEKVHYDNLALVITDEQHRFGVGQRELLSSKGGDPHVLGHERNAHSADPGDIIYGAPGHFRDRRAGPRAASPSKTAW